MPDVSPTRWHLAHTTWFFETFVFKEQPGYRPLHPQFEVLFNSYYNTVGEQFPRSERGLLSRPTLHEILDYRRIIDERMGELLAADPPMETLQVVELGLHHEQQHQELMLTDIKHVLSCNPLFPIYRENPLLTASEVSAPPPEQPFAEGVYEVGHAGSGFAFDNESPRHRIFLNEFALNSQLVTNGQFREFLEDQGYHRPELWLSLGWNFVKEKRWQAPLYWVFDQGEWFHFTLGGLLPVPPEAPVCHISYFEADAFARWSGQRLPTEGEWEVAANQTASTQTVPQELFADTLFEGGWAIQPAASATGSAIEHLFGNVWEWTASQYLPYPRYAPPRGALGEYNGKFMCNQFVLRGGSCATPAGHLRATYRNFFPPETRWQFAGMRLAR